MPKIRNKFYVTWQFWFSALQWCDEKDYEVASYCSGEVYYDWLVMPAMGEWLKREGAQDCHLSHTNAIVHILILLSFLILISNRISLHVRRVRRRTHFPFRRDRAPQTTGLLSTVIKHLWTSLSLQTYPFFCQGNFDWDVLRFCNLRPGLSYAGGGDGSLLQDFLRHILPRCLLI